MKKTTIVLLAVQRAARLIALAAIIAISMAACGGDDPEPPPPPSDSVDGGALELGYWTEEHTLAFGYSEVWFTFPVTQGSTYSVFVRDYWSSSVVVADGYADVLTDAHFGSKTGAAIFANCNAGAGSSVEGTESYPASCSFTAEQTGTVHLRVYPDPSYTIYGKFRAVVVAGTTRPTRGEDAPPFTSPSVDTPLTFGTWSSENGLIDTAGNEAWYTFPVTEGATYWHWVKDTDSSGVSSADGYIDVRTSAYYGSRTGTPIFTAADTSSGGSNGPASYHFDANQTGTVYLKVYHYSGATYGKFRVAVSTTGTRPAGEFD